MCGCAAGQGQTRGRSASALCEVVATGGTRAGGQRDAQNTFGRLCGCKLLLWSGSNFGYAGEEITEEHHRAAVKIQARARGSKTRKVTASWKVSGEMPGQAAALSKKKSLGVDSVEDEDYQDEVRLPFATLRPRA